MSVAVLNGTLYHNDSPIEDKHIWTSDDELGDKFSYGFEQRLTNRVPTPFSFGASFLADVSVKI